MHVHVMVPSIKISWWNLDACIWYVVVPCVGTS